MSVSQKQDSVLYETEKAVSVLRVSHLSIKETKLPKNRTYLFFKRTIDVIASLLLIATVLSWLLPLLALLIKIDSKGPVFFVQKRVGAFGKIFDCLKLRTMVVNAQANTEQAQVNDPRITPLGKLLRLSCLDELPQFFNVLIGNMSVIGPRPHMLEDCKEFSKLVTHYNARSLVKPGITGIAQVKGYRGKTNNIYDVVHRFKWDMYYVRNMSVKLDIQIIKLTVMWAASAIYTALFSAKQTKQPNAVVLPFKNRELLN